MEVPEWKRQLLARRKTGSVTLVAGGTRLVVTRPTSLGKSSRDAPGICPPKPHSINGFPKGISKSADSSPIKPKQFFRTNSKPEPAYGLAKPVLINGPSRSGSKENVLMSSDSTAEVSRSGSANSVTNDQGTRVAKPAIVIQVNGRDEEPRGLVSALRESYLRQCWGEDKYPPPNRSKSTPNLVEITARKFEQRPYKAGKMKKTWVEKNSPFLRIPMQVVP